ncbi:MAG TPA: glycosyltransferase [Solirubrobacteraceae bacterium]
MIEAAERHTSGAAVVGVSMGATCGVRDHATLLAAALGELDVSCELHWLSREQSSLRGARSEFRAWTEKLTAELEQQRPRAILLHYSVFSYSYRGLPLFVEPVLSTLRRTGVPVVTVLHEFAYPWTMGGLTGVGWALSQRAVLVDVVGSSRALVVTAPSRIDWLASRRWLPRRPPALAPVFSNLPSASHLPPRREPARRRIGLFGYAYEGAARGLVLDTMALLSKQGLDFGLVLLGAPGPGSPAADAWRGDARQRGVEDALAFSGVLPPHELADALAACDVLLHPEPDGPTSRKGTLAASLASGAPVVALDGPRRWDELLSAEAAAVVAPSPASMAEAVARLLADEPMRLALGRRGAEFARDAMGVDRSARVVAQVLDELDGRLPVAAGGVRLREAIGR